MVTGAVDGPRVFLGLGTNLGDRAENLRRALREIGQHADVTAVSRVYESEPFGFADQPFFWNLVAEVRTQLDPVALLEALKRAETVIGRTPTFRMGPRVIDMDILLWGDAVLETPTLSLPHPGLLQRMFVILPLLDLEPALVHPVTGESFAARAAVLKRDEPRDVGPAAYVLGDWRG